MDSQLQFNELEFNLYELLNLSVDCSTEDVKKRFKKLVRKFHPDKISDLEEKLYYNITIANDILSNQQSKDKYNMWLLKSNMSHMSLKSNFKEDSLNVKQYFPKTQDEAKIEFSKANEYLKNRHGNYTEDSRNMSSIYKDKETIRRNIPEIMKEDFNDMKDFNKKFTERKMNGVYCSKLVKREANIVPFQFKTSNYAELKDVDNVYMKDDTINYAFSLMSIDEKERAEYTTENIINNISLDDLGI
jgi:curved DNA-binding protein CbpA